jgi:adenylylsulfate kinase
MCDPVPSHPAHTTIYMHRSLNSKSPGSVLWLTGLSGAGKSTIAAAVQDTLAGFGVRTELLDGDAIRNLLPSGFTRAERDAHVRRVGFLASRLEHHGVAVICALISPYASSRQWVRQQCANFIEIHVSTPLGECERRDVKGLYAAARRGELQQFTGVDDPYEAPEAPELVIDTTTMTIAATVEHIVGAWTTRFHHANIASLESQQQLQPARG